ncbi:MAG: YfcL family protein [Gammaproteobacteria bacterium]|nr:YfcL family protein [Gammaproteobacteria bacterium]
MQLEQVEITINDFISLIVEQGSDDQMFASGYLQGHLDLILQGCLQQKQSFEQFLGQMEQSLNKAYLSNELAQPDRLLVQNCWLQLQSEF